VNESLIRGVWARSTACLFFSSLAFVLGGAQLFAVVELSYGSQTARDWVANALTVVAAGLFALGVTMWTRALVLIARETRARRRSSLS
jgi:hypothetical protein